MTEIRLSTEADWESLKAIRLAALLDAPTAFGITHASAAANSDAEWRARAVPTSERAFMLAFQDGQAVGLIGGVVSQGGEFNVIAMWVSPAWRGTSIAAGLVSGMQQHALAQGHRRLVLDVAPENARAAAFYLKQGFRFLPHWEALASHPEIQVQKMAWQA